MPFEKRLGRKRQKRQQRQQRRDREGGDEIVLVVEDLHVQRHGVGLAADMAGHHRHRAELAHGARIAKQDAIEQGPPDVGQRHGPEGFEAARAQRQSRLLVGGSLILHQRDQLARDERERDEHRREDDSRQAQK